MRNSSRLVDLAKIGGLNEVSTLSTFLEPGVVVEAAPATVPLVS